jgi:hypothetical protein
MFCSNCPVLANLGIVLCYALPLNWCVDLQRSHLDYDGFYCYPFIAYDGFFLPKSIKLPLPQLERVPLSFHANDSGLILTQFSGITGKLVIAHT